MADETLTNSANKVNIDLIRSFFDQYVKTYYPYKNEILYNVLISNLVEYFYNNTYNVIPSELKKFLEESIIDSPELYNKILIGIGVPESLVYDLSFEEKEIFLRSLGNFYQYKSTLRFVQNTALAYSETDRVNIYELYIDYDVTRLRRPWVLKPVNIYAHPKVSLDTDSIDYIEAYERLPSLLVDPYTLSEMRKNNNLVLPIKSNILLVDYTISTSVGIMITLIIETFIKEYKNNLIELYFLDGTSLTCTLGTIIFAWYYLISKYHDFVWPQIGIPNAYLPIMLIFTYDNSITTSPYNIADLEWLFNEYNNIDDGNNWPNSMDSHGNLSIVDYYKISKILRRDQYYKERISEYFVKQTTFKRVTLLELQGMLRTMNFELGSYLDARMVESETCIEELLLNIYDSLQLYIKNCGIPELQKYAPYFLKFLPPILENPEKTVVYKILRTLKPFHVELLTRYREQVLCQDLFNSIWMETIQQNFRFFMYLVSVINPSVVPIYTTTYNMFADNASLIDGCLISHSRFWEANKLYVAGEGLNIPNVGDYIALVTGISGFSEPTWTMNPGDVIVDNTIEWMCISE